VILPLLRGPDVEFVGEINVPGQTEFLGHAAALLFPIDWPEPFGLVMIEAMACGTPVIAFPCGSVPEVIEDGLTGRIVSTMDEAVSAGGCAGALMRSKGHSPPLRGALLWGQDDEALPAAVLRAGSPHGSRRRRCSASGRGLRATAHLSSATSAAISGDCDLIRDNAPPSRELCTDRV
jgi:glycosyltransferase involved in cell wall biosynthesis